MRCVILVFEPLRRFPTFRRRVILSARGLDVVRWRRAPPAPSRERKARAAERSGAAGLALRGAGMQEGLPAEVGLPSLSGVFRGLQMFSPTARCDSLNDRFWCLIIVARHRNFWAPGGFLVDFWGNSANAQVQFEGGLALNP